MADPLTIAGAGLAILGSKDLLTKLLGPTADYVGGEISGFVEKCNVNIDAIFIKATRKLGDRAETPGVVNPRILKHILDEGRFCEDEVSAEYYAGILAGSRTVAGKDDQALPYLSKIKEMSSYQLRLHFAFYYKILQVYKDLKFNLASADDCSISGLYMPHEFFEELLPIECRDRSIELMTHAVKGLQAHGLISNHAYGKPKNLKPFFDGADRNGIYMEPNFFGAELFLWAVGVESPYAHNFFELEDIEEFITIPDGAKGSRS